MKVPSRDFFTLDDALDTAFAIDRIALIESCEEEPAYPVFETVGEYIDFYKRLVGRRIAVREFLVEKTDGQAVEDELRHLQDVIGPLVKRSPESIFPEERFGQIVPIRDQRKAWTALFADFPGLLPWSGTFFGKSLAFLLVAVFFVIPTLGGIANVWFPELLRVNIFFGLAVCGFIALVFVILFQILYYRHRWKYHASTLREIAEEIIKAKKQYAGYPVKSVADVEPILLQTLSETFEIPINSLKQETRLDSDLGFVL